MANALTVARILLVIPFAFAFLANASWNMNAALFIFVIAAATDFFDGWAARRFKSVSAIGAALDPVADKLLVAAAFILLVRNGVIREAGVIAVLVILLREMLVSGLREAVAARAATLKVTGAAKFKTTLQLVAAGLLIAASPNGVLGEAWRPAAGAALWLAAILTFATGADYVSKAMKALRGKPEDELTGG